MADTPHHEQILPPDGLHDVVIGISASESPDMERLGLLEAHFRLALGDIARAVLVSGGGLAYGGHLQPDGYTSFLIQELHRYRRRDRPLLVCLAWPVHRALTLSQLKQAQDGLGLYGQMLFLDRTGIEIDPGEGRGEGPADPGEDDVRQDSFTALRRFMTTRTNARVLIGGRRAGFEGRLPGLLEEALVTLQAAQPLYLAGGFGGVTLDVIRALGVDDGAWLPTLPDMPADDERLVIGREELRRVARADGWAGLNNGLTDDENQRLAATHRPSEIAALVSLGLGRRFLH